MKKYFVTADIHGFYSLWMEALINNGFDIKNDEHILIILGDLLDRGDEPEEIIDFISTMPEDRVILIRGNHEDLFLEMIANGEPTMTDFYNGTFKTYTKLYNRTSIMSFSEFKQTDFYNIIKRMKNYYELGKYIFVHGWIPTLTKDIYIPDWRNLSSYYFNQARWANGMEQNLLGVNEPNKIIVCGHWHTAWGNLRKIYPHKEYENIEDFDMWKELELFKIYTNDGIIAIDGCTAATEIVNVLVIEEKDL